MSRRRHTPEQIISRLRESEAELANGATVTQVLAEPWRRHYNTVRPHSSLGYRPPAPETIQPWAAWIRQSTAQGLGQFVGAGQP